MNLREFIDLYSPESSENPFHDFLMIPREQWLFKDILMPWSCHLSDKFEKVTKNDIIIKFEGGPIYCNITTVVRDAFKKLYWRKHRVVHYIMILLNIAKIAAICWPKMNLKELTIKHIEKTSIICYYVHLFFLH